MFHPKEVRVFGWNIRAVAGVPKRRGKQHQHRGGVAILNRDVSNLKDEQHRITDRANGSSHQAVSWTIKSPLIARPIHITDVHVTPSEGEFAVFFHTLTQQDHYPAEDVHIYAGDFNAHVADETEIHITIQKDIPSHLKLGTVIKDIHPHHLPQLPSQMHTYPLHSEAASSGCLIPLLSSS